MGRCSMAKADRGLAFQGTRVRRLEYTVILSIVAFTVVFAGLSIWAGIGGVMRHIADLHVATIGAMLGLSLVNYGLRAWRWQMFSDALDVVVPWRRSLLYYVAGFSMTTTPGKAGEALRLWLIERCHGYGYQRIAPIFIADRLSDMLAHLLLVIIGVGAFAHYAGLTVIGAVVLVVLVFAFLRPGVLIRLVNAGYAATGRRRTRLFGGLRTTLRGTARLFTLRGFGLPFVLSVIGWFAEIVAFWLLLQALGTDVTLQQAIFIFVFSMIAGTLAMLPGGLGGTEAVMIALLVAINVDLDQAIAATAVIRLTTLWFASLLGFIALPGAMRLARQVGDAPAAPKQAA